MKQALIVSKNLIGDALCAGIALRDWYKKKGVEYSQIELQTIQDHVTRIYDGFRIPWNRVFSTEADVETMKQYYDDVFVLGAGDAGAWAGEHETHISDGFATQLGIEPLDLPMVSTPYGKFKAFKPFYDPYPTMGKHWHETTERLVGRNGYHGSLTEPLIPPGLVLFSPFSASCASRKGGIRNKMLKPEHWSSLIKFLRQIGPIRMLGAPDDLPDPEWHLTEEEIMTGVPLDWLAATMRKAKLIVTIDNGMGHLAASQDAKHILFYPMVLSLRFICPWGANNTVPIQIDPNEIDDYRLIKFPFERAAKFLLASNHEQQKETQA